MLVCVLEYITKSRRGYHDDEGHIDGARGLQGLRLISRPAVVESCPSDVEAARRVDGQLAVDEVLVTFAFQNCSEIAYQLKILKLLEMDNFNKF